MSNRHFDTFPTLFTGDVQSDGLMPFTQPLLLGRIINRPNRFLVNMEVGGEVHQAHCPTTGSVGGWLLDGLPALLSGPFDTERRRTAYGLEAIQVPLMDGASQWVGINQSNANRYVEAALLSDQLVDAMGKIEWLFSERTLGDSRIDFRAEGPDGCNTYLEVKTPLKTIHLDADVELKPTADPLSQTDRLVRHINGLANALQSGDRAILLSCFLYDAPPFRPPVGSYSEVSQALDRASAMGLERWQVNFKVDQSGVALSKLDRF